MAILDKVAIDNGISTDPVLLTATPVKANEFGVIALSASGANITTAQGFTILTSGAAGRLSFLGGFFAPSSPITYSVGAIGSSFASLLALLGTNGSAPVINGTAGLTNFVNLNPSASIGAFSANNIAGNSILVAVAISATGVPSSAITVTDTNNNLYSLLGYVDNGTGQCAGLFLAINIAAGANTATVSCSVASKFGQAGAAEVSNLANLSSLIAGDSGGRPRWRKKYQYTDSVDFNPTNYK